MSSLARVFAQLFYQLLAYLYMNEKTIGQRIRERRAYLKITQEQLATVLGVSPQYISFLELDKNLPSVVLLPKIAKELGVSIDYLISGADGVITETIPAIKADKRLHLKAKKALISLVEELYAESEER